MDRVSHAMRFVGGSIGGKYEIRRVLGIGGMGAVYEARHTYTGRRVAVKVLGPDYASSQEAVERFLQEAQAPSSIGHPNIVEVLDAGEDPQVGLYVVLEYLDGEDLEAAVERGNLDLTTLLQVVRQLLDALGAAHARGFVHRDIKPANVYLTKHRDGSLRVKLLDFGIAKNSARGLTVGNAVMGTPHYMAPEQAQGLPVDPRADLWAVGAVLFHALAGVPPYDGDHPNVIMVNIIMNEPPSLRALRPDLSDALITVVERALTKNLDGRWRDAKQMTDALAKTPELHNGAQRITTTLRNRGGAHSAMRPSAPAASPGLEVAETLHASFPQNDAPPVARSGSGTLGPEDVIPLPSSSLPASSTLTGATPALPSPSPASASPASASPASASPASASPAAPSKSRRTLLVALVAAVVATLVVVAGLSLRAIPPPAVPPVAHRAPQVAPTAPVTQAAAAPIPEPAPQVTPTPPPPTPGVPAATSEAAPDDARRHGHRPRHREHDAATVTAQPATPPAAQTTPPTRRIGGLSIPGYNAP